VQRDRDGTTERLIDFAGLYEAHAQDTRRFALYLSGDATLADDLVSEAFVRVWTARERVALPTVRGYLFATVRNLFLQYVNRQKRRAPLDEHAIDSRPDPEDVASGQSELRVVLAALNRFILLGLAIYVSTLPLSVTFDRSGFRGLLIQDWPERIVIIALAVVLWAVYFRWSRHARASGL